jgi:hypothetical protein
MGAAPFFDGAKMGHVSAGASPTVGRKGGLLYPYQTQKTAPHRKRVGRWERGKKVFSFGI